MTATNPTPERIAEELARVRARKYVSSPYGSFDLRPTGDLIEALGTQLAEVQERYALCANTLLERSAQLKQADAALATARETALEESALRAENEPEPDGEVPDAVRIALPHDAAMAAVRATKRAIANGIRALKSSPQPAAESEVMPIPDYSTPMSNPTRGP